MMSEFTSAGIFTELIQFPETVEVANYFSVSRVREAGGVVDADIQIGSAKHDVVNDAAPCSEVYVAEIFSDVHPGCGFDMRICGFSGRSGGHQKPGNQGKSLHLKSSSVVQLLVDTMRAGPALSSGGRCSSRQHRPGMRLPGNAPLCGKGRLHV